MGSAGSREVPPERPSTTPVLLAAAFRLDAECGAQNSTFLKCKATHNNPADCLTEGQAVIECSLRTLKALNKMPEFHRYADCIADNNMEYEPCRKPQGEFKKALIAIKKKELEEKQKKNRA